MSEWTDPAQSTLPLTVRGACPHDCPDTCAMVSTVVDGRVTRVSGDAQHPVTEGFLCAKVNRYHERTYHPDRVLCPLRRIGPKGEGLFERVSWETALSGIARDLARVIEEFGPQAVLPYSYAGTMGLLQRESMSARFFHRMGSSLLDRTICAAAGAAGWNSVYGDLSGPGPDELEDVRLFVLWGTNTLTSNSHLWPAIRRARHNGARVIVIDPLRTRTADAADLHVAPIPGTDAALAFGMMRALLDSELIDHDFVDAHTYGWEGLHHNLVTEWPVERASSVTGLPADLIVSLARDLAQTQPSLIRMNYGMQRHAGGASAIRAVCLLPTLTGSWRHPGGGALLSTSGAFEVNKSRLQRPDWIPPGTRTINMNRLGEALTTTDAGTGGSPIAAVVVYNSNPVIVAPDSSLVRQGFLREDLTTVVIDHFTTDTAKYADWVLPATTQLEHWDVHTAYGHHFVTINTPAIEPLGESAPNTEIFRRLARQIGFDDPEFTDSDEELVDQALASIGARKVDRADLIETGWVRISAKGHRNRNWGELTTPSGLIELCASVPHESPLDPTPQYVPARRADVSQRANDGLVLLSPPEHHLMNSSFANLPRHRRAIGEQTLWVHPEDAIAREILDGDMVEARNDRGAFRARVHITDRTLPGTVAAFGLRWASTDDRRTINDTTSMDLTDAGAGATFYDTTVIVSSVDGG